MTDAKKSRRRLVDVSVVGLSALTLVGSVSIIAEVDHARRSPDPATLEVSAGPLRELKVSPGAPISGLVPAPPRPRRVIYLRRSRAS